MELMKKCKFNALLPILTLYLSSSIVICANTSAAIESLNALLLHSAFEALTQLRPLTGPIYKATPTLPANVSGINVSFVRLRSRHFWIKGASYGPISIPPRTMPVPYRRRIAIVYQDLGNWSSYYYSLPGYRLITSVVGFSVYDASNVDIRRIDTLNLKTTSKPIAIHFHNLELRDRVAAKICASFNANGTASLSNMSSHNLCYSRNHGHFSVVVPVERKHKTGALREVLVLVGFFGVALLSIGGIIFVRMFHKTVDIAEMEKQAEEEEGLDMMWIGSSKMPSATVTRTQPILESGHLP